MSLDNRTWLNRVRLSPVQKRLDDLRGIGRNHFMLRVGDMTLGYCYLRKNACSSFKQMFLDLSPAAEARETDARPIDFMRAHHRMRESDLARCDHMVIVYRDPVQRFMSMFRNKFIATKGATDILDNFTRLEGQPPDSASFRQVVTRYLQHDLARLDRHLQPQAIHLRRTIYTDVVAIDNLHARMTAILGAPIADRYFKRPVNRSSDISLRPVQGAADLPVSALRALYHDEGYSPDDDSFLAEDLRAALRDRYAADYEMIARIEAG